jgi:beta-RFAP synthase
VKIVVETPARLHLGFIDLNGECGRIFGSIGVALERPRYVLEAIPAGATQPDGGSEASEILNAVGDVSGRMGPGGGVTIREVESIPRHRGFGSGTQRRLAVAFAVSHLVGKPVSLPELARLVGRGRRSGIGIAVFQRGGLVVDAGRRIGPDGHPAQDDLDLPPVIFQHPVPEDWYFVIVIPPGTQGLSGHQEDETFRQLPPMGQETVGRISRLTLMKVIPGVMTDDIQGFGEAIGEIQTLVGQYFAPYQGGIWATSTGKEVAARALERGAYAVGQSSWGPGLFALVRGEDSARILAQDLRDLLADTQPSVFYTRVNNRGMIWRREP